MVRNMNRVIRLIIITLSAAATTNAWGTPLFLNDCRLSLVGGQSVVILPYGDVIVKVDPANSDALCLSELFAELVHESELSSKSDRIDESMEDLVTRLETRIRELEAQIDREWQLRDEIDEDILYSELAEVLQFIFAGSSITSTKMSEETLLDPLTRKRAAEELGAFWKDFNTYWKEQMEEFPEDKFVRSMEARTSAFQQ